MFLLYEREEPPLKFEAVKNALKLGVVRIDCRVVRIDGRVVRIDGF